ncbi:Bcr/CflA family multidrug efflux MFS transporter [Pseudomonas aeruginosa]|uniref:Bcr/CflA family multidrug efflux MFS transporter n=1 Tax=Pseudomonas aeruginosa TaxID=287 RepID=UPI0022BA44E6|nr:Bcr/CflA family multidrug efflux MFS transporter [Pseudomonas aeruginosa]WBI81547.1 Bicyclomycin resistance protein [Pseudomonas aeruginosa]
MARLSTPALATHEARHPKELRILIILSALMSFASISTDLYLPALPTLAAELHAQTGRVELTISSFLIGFSLGQLLWGPIGDRHGRRLPIAAGLVLFILGSVGCALSETVWQMMGWRVVQALGACAGPVLARAMVRDLYAREHSARMLSTLILIMAVAPLLGPLLGGQMLKLWSWHAIFWSLAVVGVLTMLALLALPETLPAARRSQEPLSGMLRAYGEVLRSRRLLGYAISGGFFYGGAYAFIAGTPFAYIDYYHVPAQAYGLLFGVNILGIMAANYLNTRLVMRLGSDALFRIGAGIAAVTGVLLALDTRFGWGGLVGLALPVFFYMSMNGLIVANSVAAALTEFPHRAGAVSAMLGAMHYGSGILSAALVGWLADGTPWTMGWIIGLCGVGCLLTALFSTSSIAEPVVAQTN